MWPGFSSFIADDMSSKDKVSYLMFIYENENLALHDDNDKRLVCETIVKWVSSPLLRNEGLWLWFVSLEKCHLYLHNWGGILRASLEPSSSISNRKVALKILNQMVLKFGNQNMYLPAFQKFMPDLMTCLLLDLEDNEACVLSCASLAVCIKHLPEMLGYFTANIEDFFVKHLDDESNEVVEALSDCFAIFPSSSRHFIKPKCSYSDGWVNLYSKTLNTLQSLFEDILLFQTGSNGPRSENNRTPIFIIPCDLEGGLSYLCHKVRVFYSLNRCLAKLMCSFSLRVQVFLEDMLELIQRVIFIDEQVATEGMDKSIIYLIFPRMCQTAFMLLEAIVLNFSVVEYTDNILKLASKAITDAQAYSCHSIVHLSSFKFLNTWMKESGCTVSYKIVSDTIIEQLLKSVAIPKAENDGSEMIKQTCTEAVKVLNVLITSACNFFEKKTIEIVISTILQIVKQVQFYSHPLKSFPYPYSDDTCRLELYKLLLTCCVNEHPCQKNCTIKSVNLFKLGQRDPSIEVTSVCHKAYNLIVHVFNPKKPLPDYTLPVHIETPQMNAPAAEVTAGWEVTESYEDNWPQEHQNGQANPRNNLLDSQSYQEGAEDLDSPPCYAELGPSNQYNNARTVSGNSSLTGDVDESESDEEEVLNEGRKNSTQNRPCNRVPNKQKRAPINIPMAQKTTRPNIQVLQARTNEARTDDTSDANTMAIGEVQSDKNSMEDDDESPGPSPKEVASENGGVEESDEEEEGFDEDDDEEEEEEDEAAAGDFANEERFSPEPEERPSKKQKHNRVEEMSSEEESNRPSAECEEVVSNEDLKDEVEINQELNGQQNDNASSLRADSPTVEEMVSDFVLEEAEDVDS